MTAEYTRSREEEIQIFLWYYDSDSSSRHSEDANKKSNSSKGLVSNMERALAASEYRESGFTVSPPNETRRS